MGAELSCHFRDYKVNIQVAYWVSFICSVIQGDCCEIEGSKICCRRNDNNGK